VYFTQAQSSLDRLDSCLDSHPWFSVACSEASTIFQFDKSARVHQPDVYSRYVWNEDCYPYNPLWNPNNLTPAQLYAELVYGTTGGILHELLHQFFSSQNHCNQCPAAMNSGAGGSSRDYLSESNITSVHRALAITKLRKFVVQDSSPPNGLATNDTTQYDFIEINQNDVIDFNFTVYQDIVIRSGNTLTVQCKLQMPKMGKIIIEPGAQLIVDEGIITTLGGYYWYGIQIEGSSGPQTTTNQGKLVLKNGALLDNVQYAINFGKEGSWNDFGGIVHAEDATIRVSRRAAAFMTYPHTNNSYFKRCTLEYVTGLTESPLSLVTLWDNHGVNFDGCTFKDETGINQYLDGQNEGIANGIYSIDASYQVLADCNFPLGTTPTSPCPTQYTTRSSFTNFNQGVYATGAAGTRTVTVDQADFVDNAISMRVKGLDDVRFTRNTVLTGGVHKNGYSGPYSNPSQIGFFADDATGFEVEQNVFEKRTNATEDVLGINVKESGEDPNEVYNNIFKNNNIGQKFDDLNRSKQLLRSFIGLQFLCNDNSVSNGKDVVVNHRPVGSFSQLQDDGIRGLQGTTNPSSAASNLFSTTTQGHIENNSKQVVTYHYNGGGRSQPTNYTAALVIPNAVGVASTCANKYYSNPRIFNAPQGVVGNYYTQLQQYNGLLYTYHQNIDGGNTEQMLETIGMTIPSEAQMLRDELMAEAPYLSEEAIRDAASTGILTDALLLEICLANPDATRNEGFLDYVEYEIPDPLPSNMVQLIYLNWDAETPRTLIENQLANLSAQLGRTASQLLHIYELDTIVQTDSIESLLNSKKTMTSLYQLAELKVQEGQFSGAINKLNNLEGLYELDEAQQAEHTNFKNYVNFRANLVTEGIDYMQLTTYKLEELRGYASAGTGRSSALAQNILCFGYGECMWEAPAAQGRKKAKRVYDLTVDAKLVNSSVLIAPNPATEIIQLSLTGIEDFAQVELQIINAEGKLIKSLRITASETTVNVAELAKGSYSYLILQQQSKIAEGKLIKQ